MDEMETGAAAGIFASALPFSAGSLDVVAARPTRAERALVGPDVGGWITKGFIGEFKPIFDTHSDFVINAIASAAVQTKIAAGHAGPAINAGTGGIAQALPDAPTPTPTPKAATPTPKAATPTPTPKIAIPTPIVNSINTFVQCLNTQLAGKPADISNTVSCLPNGCYKTLTMSSQSAQAACTLAGVQLPRA